MSMTQAGEASVARPNHRPLNAKQVLFAHAVVRGLNNIEAGLEAGFKDGPGLKGNMARLKQRPEVRELIVELAAQAADGAGIYDAWILSNIRLFAKASLAHFWKRNESGQVIVNKHGEPMLDLTNASEDQLRCLSELSHGKYGPTIKIHKPLEAFILLARCRGLLNEEKISVAVNNTVATQVNNGSGSRGRIAGEIDALVDKFKEIGGGEISSPAGG